MEVLIGYDGSEPARDAIRELHRAGLPRDTRATLVSVADVSPARLHEPPDPADPAYGSRQAPGALNARAVVDAAAAKARAAAAEGSALLKAEFPGWTVTDATYAGSPAEALTQPPDGVPDLIVVGSQGRSALGRLVMGSVSQQVLVHAPCSVRVGRRPTGAAQRGGAVRIVLGIDGSPDSALAVTAVAARVWPAGTEVKVVAAIDLKLLTLIATPVPVPRAAPWNRTEPWTNAAPVEAAARDWAGRAVEAVAAELRAAGLTATPVVEEADPKRLLLDEAERWSADCIFVGAKGHSAVERFLLGSVSASVAARASCSVEVVRQG
jgi:nucleotide-binding universal stress UspA family protein